jgi:hypothetical protein
MIEKAGINPTFGRLFFLDLSCGRVLTVSPDSSDLKTIVSEGRRLPDGIVVEASVRQSYRTNMANLPTMRSACSSFQETCRMVRSGLILRGLYCAQLNRRLIKTFAMISRDLASFIRSH